MENIKQKSVDTICSLRNGSADDKQFRATVEHNIDLAIAERDREWKKELIGLLRVSKTEWKALEDLIEEITNSNK